MSVSFAKVPGAGSSAPVAPRVDATPEDEARNLPAVQAPRAPVFYTGDEDTPTDVGDIRLPYLNLVQPSSKADMKAIGKEGEFVFARAVNLGSSFRAVIAGFSPKFYREKVKWGSTDQGRIAIDEEQVERMGGTTLWKFSRENDKSDSRKPWFQPTTKALLLIEKPENAAEEFFPHVADGKAYAAALLELKSTAFDSFFKEVQSKKATTTLFRGGYASRFVKVISAAVNDKADASLKPIPQVLEPTTAEILALANKVAKGS